MPIIEIEIVNKIGESFPPDLAANLADEMGKVFASPAGGTWVRLRFLPRQQYGENGGLTEIVNPVFVTVLKADLPSLEQRKLEAQEIAGIVANLCSRPQENVHIVYLPSAAGLVAFGGQFRLD